MSKETYEQARSEVIGSAPMTPARWRNMPDWLKNHLTNLVARLDDSYQEVDRLKDLLEAIEIPAEVPDHTRPSIETPGRYAGDYFASLEFDPLRDDKYRWVVTVAVWRQERYTAKGHAEGYVDRDYWAEPHTVFGDLASRRFKTSEKAIAYITKVRGFADAELIRRRLDTISKGERTRLA